MEGDVEPGRMMVGSAPPPLAGSAPPLMAGQAPEPLALHHGATVPLEGHYELASPVSRLSAWLLDVSVVLVAIVLVVGVLSLLFEGIAVDSDNEGFWLASMAVLVAHQVIQAGLIKVRGQTIGKAIMGLRIIRTDGRPCGLFYGYVARYWPMGWAMAVTAGIIGLLNALMIFSDYHRTLRDRIADTLVVVVPKS